MDKLEMLFRLNNKIFDCSNRALRVVRIPKEIKSSAVRKNNIRLKKYKRTDRCYVVGLGPSLRNADLDRLDGDIITVNRYYRFDLEATRKPTYYCVSDKAFFGGNAAEELKTATRQYPDSCFILNGLYKAWCDKELSHGHLFYSYMWNGTFAHRKSVDFTKVLPIANNVVNVAIMLALYCGYREIYLLGCDFNSFASPVANHCYKDEKSERLWKLDFELYCYSLIANSHAELKRYADGKGMTIKNITKGSLLDAYDFDEEMIAKMYE